MQRKEISNMKQDSRFWIDRLHLKPHPEGGLYNEVFAGPDILNPAGLPEKYPGPRKAYTSIYFLLKSGQISRLHRLRSDELWHFYTGSALTVHVIDADGACVPLKLGADPEKGETFQARVRAGCWFGATVDQPNSFSLVGCVVAPGFEFEDFELGDRADLIRMFPQHRKLIERLTESR